MPKTPDGMPSLGIAGLVKAGAKPKLASRVELVEAEEAAETQGREAETATASSRSRQVSSEQPSQLEEPTLPPPTSRKKEPSRQINFRVPESVFYAWGDAMRYLDMQSGTILEEAVRKWLAEHKEEVESAIARRGTHR